MDVTYDRSVLYEAKRQFGDLFAIRESFGSIGLTMSNKFLFQVSEILKERYEKCDNRMSKKGHTAES